MKQRKWIRLKKYDYSDAGWYFVTICSQNMECLFGNVVDNQIKLNKFGKIVQQYWLRISEYFDNVVLDEFVIMPNHIHGIVVIRNSSVGAGFPRPINQFRPLFGQIIGYFKYQSTKKINILIKGSGNPTPTKEPNKIFQRSYYEHVIRNEMDLFRIRQYIYNNPGNWEMDQNNKIVQNIDDI
jgi:REP element-mobilizing transposase RayT